MMCVSACCPELKYGSALTPRVFIHVSEGFTQTRVNTQARTRTQAHQKASVFSELFPPKASIFQLTGFC